MSCSSLFYPCRLRLRDILIVCLVFKFLTEVMNCFIQAFFQWDLFQKEKERERESLINLKDLAAVITASVVMAKFQLHTHCFKVL